MGARRVVVMVAAGAAWAAGSLYERHLDVHQLPVFEPRPPDRIIAAGDPDGKEILGAMNRSHKLAGFGGMFHRQDGVTVGGINEGVHDSTLIVGQAIRSHAMTRIRM